VTSEIPNTNSRVIVLLNGDMFPPNRHDGRYPQLCPGATYMTADGTQIAAASLTSSALTRLITQAVSTFVRGVLNRYPNAHVVFNLGNHEFYTDEFGDLLHMLSDEEGLPVLETPRPRMLGEYIQSGRLHIITDANQRLSHHPDDHVQFSTSITVHGIPIVGYCTRNHYHQTLFTLPPQGSDPVINLLAQSIGTSRRVIFASHAGAAETGQILARLRQQHPHLPHRSIYLYLGHDHFNFQQPNDELQRQYPELAGVYQSLAYGGLYREHNSITPPPEARLSHVTLR
jgi:hypothetical protein